MLKSLGFLSWIACLLTLGYQSAHWVLFKEWPSLDMYSILQSLFGLDLVSVLEAVSLETAAKLLYVAMTTELALFLWWTGVVMFVLMLLTRLFGK